MPRARTLYSLMQDLVNILEQCKIQAKLSNGHKMDLPIYSSTIRLNPISYFTPTPNFRVPPCPSEQSYKA